MHWSTYFTVYTLYKDDDCFEVIWSKSFIKDFSHGNFDSVNRPSITVGDLHLSLLSELSRSFSEIAIPDQNSYQKFVFLTFSQQARWRANTSSRVLIIVCLDKLCLQLGKWASSLDLTNAMQIFKVKSPKGEIVCVLVTGLIRTGTCTRIRIMLCNMFSSRFSMKYSNSPPKKRNLTFCSPCTMKQIQTDTSRARILKKF